MLHGVNFWFNLQAPDMIWSVIDIDDSGGGGLADCKCCLWSCGHLRLPAIAFELRNSPEIRVLLYHFNQLDTTLWLWHAGSVRHLDTGAGDLWQRWIFRHWIAQNGLFEEEMHHGHDQVMSVPKFGLLMDKVIHFILCQWPDFYMDNI